MLALGVVDVGDIQILINVVDTEGDLRTTVHTVIAADKGSRVQLIPHGGHIVLGHEDNGGLAGLVQLVDGILKSALVEGLVIDVQAGIDDCDLAACAGVAQIPGFRGAGHLGGSDVLNLILRGVVAGLDDDILNADDVADSLDLAVLYICGNDVRAKRQIPDNIQICAAESFGGDLLRHSLLVSLQAGTVGSGIGRRIACINGGCP